MNPFADPDARSCGTFSFSCLLDFWISLLIGKVFYFLGWFGGVSATKNHHLPSSPEKVGDFWVLGWATGDFS